MIGLFIFSTRAMELATFTELLSPLGQSALLSAGALNPSEEQFLPLYTRLAKSYPAALAKAALETILLRQKASKKFTRAEQMYFVREALEQATHESLSLYRAQRFAGQVEVLDLGCGIGGDSIGLAGVAAVQAYEQDAVRLAMAQHNLSTYHPTAQISWHVQDFTQTTLPPHAALWLDPARRLGQKRISSVQHYQPPLEFIRPYLKRRTLIGVKLSPAVNLAELSVYEGQNTCEVEFISYERELREAVLWAGEHATTFDTRAENSYRRATVLPSGETLTWQEHAPVSTSLPLNWLYEPDPAILRAGLVTLLASQLSAFQLDANIAYLTAHELQTTAFARAFSVVAHFPFSLKQCRAELRARQIGKITVKKRGSPLDVLAFERAMKLSGSAERHLIVFLTHVQGKPWVIFGEAV
ncbi:MAG TPA: class I SAM-dependent methyltransferase [Anaerolineales bacterium]|nr:class I SAM-dependent methyltransferase [Anaerolineales bacterium]